jgi:hypothetical protein
MEGMYIHFPTAAFVLTPLTQPTIAPSSMEGMYIHSPRVGWGSQALQITRTVFGGDQENPSARVCVLLLELYCGVTQGKYNFVALRGEGYGELVCKTTDCGHPPWALRLHVRLHPLPSAPTCRGWITPRGAPDSLRTASPGM